MSVTPNNVRIRELTTSRCGPPRFTFGSIVREPYGSEGAIDVVYADYQAALDAFIIRKGWYEAQERPLKTPKTGYWYGVVLSTGAVLVGEDDLELVRAPAFVVQA